MPEEPIAGKQKAHLFLTIEGVRNRWALCIQYRKVAVILQINMMKSVVGIPVTIGTDRKRIGQ